MKCLCGYLPEARCKWFAYGIVDATDTPLSLATVFNNSIMCTVCDRVRCRSSDFTSNFVKKARQIVNVSEVHFHLNVYFSQRYLGYLCIADVSYD